MKLNYLQLENHLSNQKLLPVYIIAGEEWQQRQESLQLIRKCAKQQGFTERFRLSQESIDPDTLTAKLYGNSLMGEKRLVEIDCRHQLPTKHIADLLSNFKSFAEILLLIEVAKLEPKIEKSTWFSHLEKQGAVIAVWPLTLDKHILWIKQRALKYKLNLSKAAIELLAEHTLGNISAALQTIEKLYLLQPEGMVDTDLLQHIIQDDARFTVFHLVDHLLSGKTSEALKILELLKQEAIEPVLILWSLTRELRLLITLDTDRQKGLSFDELCKKHRIFYQRQALIKQFLTQHHSIERSQQLLLKALEIDKMIKGVSIGNVWQALQIFCLRFAY